MTERESESIRKEITHSSVVFIFLLSVGFTLGFCLVESGIQRICRAIIQNRSGEAAQGKVH